jgi:hypothetical protein
MTTTQQLILLGTIWAAPHVNKDYALLVSGIFFIVAVCNGLRWI